LSGLYNKTLLQKRKEGKEKSRLKSSVKALYNLEQKKKSPSSTTWVLKKKTLKLL
jgi:hypothetical protein